MTYINQIFGDETIRAIIKEVYNKRGKLVVLPSGPEFENSVHHVYYYDSDEEVEMPEFDRTNPEANVVAATSPRHTPLGNNGTNLPHTRGGATTSQGLNISNSIVKNVLNGVISKIEKGEMENSDDEMNSDDEEEEEYSSKVCSVDNGYQDLEVDINDTLCQSYSLMSLLDIDFDSTPSKLATKEQKYNKHLSMINMYRKILNNRKFQREFKQIIQDEDNQELWEDVVNEQHIFFIIKELKTAPVITEKIKKVLDIWERWGWQFFVGDGKCAKIKSDGGRRQTRRKRRGFL